MVGIRIGRHAPAALVIVTSCLFAIAMPAQSAAASGEEAAAAGKMAVKPSSIVTTPTGPQEFGRDSVYATQPPSPGNPVLAGGLTADEAGGAPLYATQLTHPSGPVMEGGNDLQPYGRDSVYVAGSPNASPLSYPGGRQSRVEVSEASPR
jgi:hypothetical protein